MERQRLRIQIQGIVQGVGFRPFVYREAIALGLVGFVRNGSDGVTIEAQGPKERLALFLQNLQSKTPPQALIQKLSTSSAPSQEEEHFTIIESQRAGVRPSLPADLAICQECHEEIQTPSERRFRYPFTNCTNCGPRYTIVTGLPYDRPLTSLRDFVLCEACRKEYQDPRDRRFHAQPVACPACGPSLSLLSPKGEALATKEEALSQAIEALQKGSIVALQGLGGFQLLVDATNEEAVQRLRQRKRREEKPFAILVSSLLEARSLCLTTPEEEALLSSPEAPIVLMQKRTEGEIAFSVAPQNPFLGVMLAYTPLHVLVSQGAKRPLVCTSGNLSDEPMCITTEEALITLASIADLFLVHNRPIVRPVDDSVARVLSSRTMLLRRARGFAPKPIQLPVSSEAPSVLALGGFLKGTITLTMGDQAIVSQHLGDLDSASGASLLRRTVEDFLSFFEATPAVVAGDLHPDYTSTRLAEALSERFSARLIRVQHHHAHLAACAAEHHLVGDAVGFAWDGAGLGSDGTLWGGETLLYQGARFTRLAHLRTFPLPGGEKAIREPRRSALGLLFEAFGDKSIELLGSLFSRSEQTALLSMLQRGVQCPQTSSVGRLFDAVSALLGVRPQRGFEGQAAMMLEQIVDPTEEGSYPISIEGNELDWRPLLEALLQDKQKTSVSRCAARFHNALLEAAVALAKKLGLPKIILSGGCFQNAFLTQKLVRRLQEEGFQVFQPERLPPNDGGLSLGQAMVALLSLP